MSLDVSSFTAPHPLVPPRTTDFLLSRVCPVQGLVFLGCYSGCTVAPTPLTLASSQDTPCQGCRPSAGSEEGVGKYQSHTHGRCFHGALLEVSGT